MSYELYFFPEPLNTTGTGRIGDGREFQSHPFTHQPTGRLGISFTLPADTPNGNQFTLTLHSQLPNRNSIVQRGILWLNNNPGYYPFTPGQQAAVSFDDFVLPLIPVAPIPPEHNPNADPRAIIQAVYDTGRFNLATHDGCGQFTEECCKQLHEIQSDSWGNIRKNPGQEQYNGHAIDAVMLLNSMPNCDRGIYDIIRNSQTPQATPSLDFVGPPNASLWYYPA